MSTYIYAARGRKPNGAVPQINATVHVRSCGHFIVNKNFRDNPMRKNFLELFWGVRGTAAIGFHGKKFRLQPRTVFFYLPGDFHDITACTAPLEYYWVTFDGNTLNDLIRHFQIREKIIQTDICPINLFRQLGEHLRANTIRDEYLASAIGYQILSIAMAGEYKEKPIFEKFRELIQLNYNDPELSIDRIANQLNIHRTTLNRCLETVSGMSPGHYLTAFRMQEALSLIKNSNRPFKDIASEVGFSDQNYFAKAIRRQFGVTPTELRRNSERQ